MNFGSAIFAIQLGYVGGYALREKRGLEIPLQRSNQPAHYRGMNPNLEVFGDFFNWAPVIIPMQYQANDTRCDCPETPYAHYEVIDET